MWDARRSEATTVTTPPSQAPPPPPTVAPVRAAVPVRPQASARRGSIVGPLSLVLALAAAALLAAVLLSGLGREDGGIGNVPTSSPTPSAAPSPSDPPWLAELVARIMEKCGLSAAAESEHEMATMTEEEAKEHAKAVERSCEDSEGGGNGNEGGGNGNEGGGNGNEGTQGRGGGDN